jgi:hypothetical protein
LSHHLANGLHHQSIGRSVRCSLCRWSIGWTARCSPTSHSSYSLLGLHHQLRWVLASCAGDLTFGFFMQLSPAKLGTPRRSSSLCKSRLLSWGLPWWSVFATSLFHSLQ